MATTQPDLELVEILKRLGSRLALLADRVRACDGDAVLDNETYEDALWYVCCWVANRTDLEKWDVWHAAHRLDTGIGLAPYKKQTGDKAEYRDLRFIPPKLKELDRDGSTSRLIAERPEIAELVDLSPATKHEAKRPRRKRRAALEPKQLTARQVEIVQLYGECKGDFAEMRRRLGVDRKTVVEIYEAASRKLGTAAVANPSTTSMPQDHRGQVNVSEDRRV